MNDKPPFGGGRSPQFCVRSSALLVLGTTNAGQARASDSQARSTQSADAARHPWSEVPGAANDDRRGTRNIRGFGKYQARPALVEDDGLKLLREQRFEFAKILLQFGSIDQGRCGIGAPD